VVDRFISLILLIFLVRFQNRHIRINAAPLWYWRGDSRNWTVGPTLFSGLDLVVIRLWRPAFRYLSRGK
jgi:hypothetical protein